jgi:dephospho-CoA kinase
MPPAFDNSKIMVIYVLGGPGAGKSSVVIFERLAEHVYRQRNAMWQVS